MRAYRTRGNGFATTRDRQLVHGGHPRQGADHSDLPRSTDSHIVKRLTTVAAMLLTGACAAGSTAPTSPPPTTVASTAATGSTPEASPPSVASTLSQETPPTCDESAVFDHPPVDLDAVELLVPFGLVSGSHVTPVDHQYFQNFLEPDRAIDVYSPGAGRVVSIQHFGAPVSENSEGLVNDFRLVIEHTCTISSIFIRAWRGVRRYPPPSRFCSGSCCCGSSDCCCGCCFCWSWPCSS